MVIHSQLLSESLSNAVSVTFAEKVSATFIRSLLHNSFIGHLLSGFGNGVLEFNLKNII